jgi:hypothetical protein
MSLVSTLQVGVQGQVQQQQQSPAPPSPGTIPAPSTTTGATQGLDAAGVGRGAAVNQTAMVMIPQSSVMMMLSNLQIAMNAVEDDEDTKIKLESVDQELRSAANASGMSIGNTTDEGEEG